MFCEIKCPVKNVKNIKNILKNITFDIIIRIIY